MTKEKVIEYLRKEVACDNAGWDTCKHYLDCKGCPNDYSVPLIVVIKAALELLEKLEGES